MSAEQDYVEDVLLEVALRKRCPSGPAPDWPEDDECDHPS